MTNKPANTNRFWTIPNVMTLLRFAMIPLIAWLYIVRREFFMAAVVAGISALTDVFDGIIARKFDMVTDIGKIIDPVADKLTQATVIFCLSMRYPYMSALFCVHVAKEIIMGVMGVIALRKKSINSAKWYGKMSTIVLFFVTVTHLVIPQVSDELSLVLVAISMAAMAVALALYIRFYFKLLYHKTA